VLMPLNLSGLLIARKAVLSGNGRRPKEITAVYVASSGRRPRFPGPQERYV